MANDQEQARAIAERVARRVKGGRSDGSTPARPRNAPRNGAPVGEALSEIRAGLHDLEKKLERIESKIVHGHAAQSDQPRARVIDFVASTPPLNSPSSISKPPAPAEEKFEGSVLEFVPPTYSPWLKNFNATVEHPSQERFGVEEATVAELVEFFESEKKCSVEPGEKPCDHCAMCSSRGF